MMSFLSVGMFLQSKNAFIFLIKISPSVLPCSGEDFSSCFSSGATLPGMPRVAMIEAATR